MNFEDELSKGNFMISECTRCKNVVWPPNEICSKCFGKTTWKNASRKGKILEFSKESNRLFCLAEFEDKIRVMGTLDSDNMPEIGQKVQLEKVSIHGGNYNFEMRLC